MDQKKTKLAPGSFARPLVALGAALCASLVSPAANASGFLGARFGSDHGTPVGANPYSLYFNPAAIAAAKGTQISADAAVIYRLATYERPESALSPGSTASIRDDAERTANTGQARVSNILALPFIGATSDLGTKNLHVGVASYIPFGGLANWDRDPTKDQNGRTPGAVDGPQRWFNISGRIISLYNTAAVAVTIPGTTLSFGVNGSYVLSEAHTVRARNADGSDDTRNPNGTQKEGRALIDVSGGHLAAALGVYWEPVPDKVFLGASYSIRPGLGEMRLKGTLRTQLGTVKDEGSQDVELVQTYPDVFRLGGAARVNDKLEVRADFEYVTWSNFQRQCLVQVGGACNLTSTGAEVTPPAGQSGQVIQNIDRGWHDAGGVRVGLGYQLTDHTEVFGSGGVDTSAVPLATLDPTFIDADKFLGVIGVKHKFGRSFALAGSYNHVYFLTENSEKKNRFQALEGVSRQPSAAGTYNQQFMFININGTVMF